MRVYGVVVKLKDMSNYAFTERDRSALFVSFYADAIKVLTINSVTKERKVLFSAKKDNIYSISLYYERPKKNLD